jgi:L-lactate dehydrogenase complex protein LldG
MSAREDIFARVRKNRPTGNHELPLIPDFDIQGSDQRLQTFSKTLKAMGGNLVRLSDISSVREWIQGKFPDAKIICSAVTEVPSDRALSAVKRPQDLADVDVGVVRAILGVAESGSVLFSETELKVNTLAYLSQHLVVLLREQAIVDGLQDAYAHSVFRAARYAVFHTGPSASADIEGVLFHGAQGVRSLTVILET